MKLLFRLFSLAVLFLLIPGSRSTQAFSAQGRWTGHYVIHGNYILSGSTKKIAGKGEINVYLPSRYQPAGNPSPLIIALPGWRARADEWRTKAEVERYAEQYGYVVALVELWTTAYETAYYPETNPRFKWGEIPGTIWAGEVVMPHLHQKYNVDKTGKKTGIFGLSTGGRGAVYIPQKYPKYFRAGVTMSGDFDRISLLNWTIKHRKNIMHHDPPSVTIYGDPRNNPRILKRWKDVDNPVSDENVKILLQNKIAILVIHGLKDYAVPVEMSRELHQKLKAAGVDVRYVEDEIAGHDWYLWKTYLPLTFQFFEEKFAR